MAGGKETPRQKMIGMMYLVLTALLALNVSTTVIDKFVFLNDSLVRANKQTDERNDVILKSIAGQVEKSGNRPDDKAVLDVAKELDKEADRILDSLKAYKVKMVDITGNYTEGYEPDYPGDAKNLVGKTDYDKIGNWMLPVEEKGQGQGEHLKKLLNDYSEFVKSKMIAMGAEESDFKAITPMALDADEDPVYSQDPNQKGKSFADLTFHSSPTPAALATMSEFESRVLGYETLGLDFLSKKVGAKDMKFDVVVPMVNPESKYVAAGSKYTAKMFIAASSSSITPTMSYNGNSIEVVDGQGLVEFTASAKSYDKDGLSQQSFEAAIDVTLPNGQDTTYTSTIEYFVVQPIIQIQSQSVNALYINCGNKLDVQVPALGTNYNPSFSATNGDAIKGASKGQVTIIPNSPKEVTLNVASNGQAVGSRKFSVRGIPQPAIVAYTAPGEEVDLKSGISAKQPRLYIKPVADESFKAFLPDDANYRIAKAEVTLVSGGIGRKTIQVGENINLGSLTSQARKGDQLVIEIKSVQRQNFRKQIEEVQLSKSRRFISIPLK